MLVFCVLLRLNGRFTMQRNYSVAQLMQFLKKQGEQHHKRLFYNWSSAKVFLLFYAVCPLTKSDLLSVDFVINGFLMKLFKTSNINRVK